MIRKDVFGDELIQNNPNALVNMGILDARDESAVVIDEGIHDSPFVRQTKLKVCFAFVLCCFHKLFFEFDFFFVERLKMVMKLWI